ncbi:ketopantoate reductase family protein [Hydrogenophaga sp. BPS33]|uniref:ketopantoate reductase family protein n=1 Tax=Hydrogenophaga sp. BPS33 TaxID=2651974 RepID=UPI00131FE6CF|nr:2-dehydropantoate 2-reductase [Hydrogenophaga sp. BPS33]QHE84153.1 2-dehydropantoate 2-reductase [Hydrogenophaga sp. BPS33]
MTAPQVRKKVCIFGGGAIGGYIAGVLEKKGDCEVSVVARGKNLQAMRERGLTVSTPEGRFTVRPKVTDEPGELGLQDYVFITLKEHQFADALPQFGPLLGPQTAVIPPTTGIPYWFFHQMPGAFKGQQLAQVDPGGRIWSTIHPSRVIGAVFWIGAHLVAPGEVRQDGAKAGCPIGEPDGTRSERVQALSRLLTDAGLNARVRDNIRGDIWVKATNSLCWNPVATLAMARMQDMAATPECIALVQAMMEEADAMATRIGLDIPYPPRKRIETTLSAAEHKMSMLQDLELGRPLEIGAIETSLRAMQQLSGVSTPLIDGVLAIMKTRDLTYTQTAQTGQAGHP